MLCKPNEKVMESIIAELLLRKHLLPTHDFVGHHRKSVAMMVLSDDMHAAWKRGVAGALNDPYHKRLRHNMQQRRRPQVLTR
jgi:hypothetical protein